MSFPSHILPARDVQPFLVIGGETYVPTFADDFAADEPSVWRGYGSGGTWATSFSPHQEDARTIASNGELQYYADPDMTLLPGAFTMDGQAVSIAATPLSAGQRAHAGGLGYGSGLLTTEMSFSLATGYVEIRADVPDETGLWSAFWLLPSDGGWSAEIDVFEFLGEDTDSLHTTFWSDGRPDSLSVAVDGAGDGFHTYGLLWTAGGLGWYYDGALVHEEDRAPTEKMFLVLNLAVGGWAADPDATTDFGDRLRADYIRVYELEASATRNPAIGEGPLPDGGQAGSDAGELIDGSRWADRIHAGGGHDTVYGDGGDDSLFGGAGGDQLFGHGGADRLAGGGGRDKLVGGLDRDVLVGGKGTDHLWGGNYRADGSADVFVFKRGCGVDYIHDFEAGRDRIDIASLPLTADGLVAGLRDEGWAVRVNLGLGPDGTPDAVYLVGLSSHDISRQDFELMGIA